MSEQNLPLTWVTVRLKELARSRMGKTILKSDLTETGLSVYSAGASTEPWGRLEGCEVSYGADTLVISARGNIGMPKRPRQIPFVCTQTTIACSAYLPETVDWLFWFLSRFDYSTKSSQTTIPMLRTSDVDSFEIPLPPLAEQKRIVAKIEELFSELEAGEESLRVARRQLGVYRQSLLKQAFEGKLTSKWRTENPAKLESPATLLYLAAENRRMRWNGRGKYQPAIGPKLDAERPIPDCWAYASVDQVTLNFDGQRVPLKREDRDKRAGAYPYYGASGVIDDIDDFLFDGDFLLIAEDGANLLSRSTPIAFQARGKFWVNNHAHIVQPVSAMLMRYLELFLNGRDLTRFISGTAQPKLNQANLDQVPVPLCSLPEQQEIVRKLDEQFEVIDRNERELDAALKRSEALRQAILKKAFTGRLVPQSPTDEPAQDLLARLRAERASNLSPSTRRRASTP